MTALPFIFDIDNLFNQQLELKEDIIAISCAYHRLNNVYEKTKDIKYVDLIQGFPNSDVLASNVGPEDRELATKIREYYSGKLSFLVLKEIPLTNFKQKLYTFIQDTNTHIVDHEVIGIAYRLPQFYQYDIDIKEKVFNRAETKGVKSFQGTKKMQFIFKTLAHTKLKEIEYWFLTEGNHPVVISLSDSNPLLPLLDAEIKNNNNILTIQTFFERRKEYSNAYYRVPRVGWKIV